MIPPPTSSSTRVATLGLAIAFLAASAFAVTASRLSREQRQVEQLQARQAQLEAELQDLRARLGQGAGTGVLDRVQAAVARLRGLAFKSRVNATVLTNDQLRARVMKALDEDSPRAEIETNAKVLRALGLLRADQDLFKILRDVHLEQVGGYYDTDEKRMFVGGDATNPSPLERTLLAHEYTHAVTDQHFDLARLDKLTEMHKDDEAEAFLSLIEGDATLLMGVYAREALTNAEKVELGREAAGIESEKLDAAPKALQASLLFPYDAGVRFAQALFERGGNRALDAAYRDPPVSTEQIIHPEKYYARRDAPQPVTLPNLASAMGAGWKTIQEGGVGELDVRLILGEYLAISDTNDAAAGWDGGRYVAVESSSGVLLAALTEWDSASEADEAEEAFSSWLPRRFGRKGSEKRISGVEGTAWEAPDGAAEVIRSGTQVLVLIGPDLASVEKARGAFRLGARAA